MILGSVGKASKLRLPISSPTGFKGQYMLDLTPDM